MRSKGSVNTERWETAAASDRVNNFLAIEKNYVCSSDWTSYFLFIKKKKKTLVPLIVGGSLRLKKLRMAFR